MILTRFGKCAICRQPARCSKEFTPTLDLFNPAAAGINASIAADIELWRKTRLYCNNHKGFTDAKSDSDHDN